MLAVALERGAQGLVVGIPVQPGGRLTDPDSDSSIVSRAHTAPHRTARLLVTVLWQSRAGPATACPHAHTLLSIFIRPKPS